MTATRLQIPGTAAGPRPEHCLRIATLNVNGIRAAVRRGLHDWLAGRGIDVLLLQEVRAPRSELDKAFGADWSIAHDEASAAGRAGVAIVSRLPLVGAMRTGLGPDTFDSAGRWIEAQVAVAGSAPWTLISCYVHAGEVDTPKQEEKWQFLQHMEARMDALAAGGTPVLVAGDLNIGHTPLDIRNWKGNVRNSGFLPRERASLDRIMGPRGAAVTTVDGAGGQGLGWIDIGRQAAGPVEGPYSWWSWRGQAFDRDTGWRIDYHLATPSLAQRACGYVIDRAPSYDARFTDHAPVVADYQAA